MLGMTRGGARMFVYGECSVPGFKGMIIFFSIYLNFLLIQHNVHRRVEGISITVCPGCTGMRAVRQLVANADSILLCFDTNALYVLWHRSW
jgi:hypothetical protein